MIKKISVNQEMCMGCGFCVACAPDIFELGKDFKSRIKKDGQPYEEVDLDISPEQESKLNEAISGCPEKAISAN